MSRSRKGNADRRQRAEYGYARACGAAFDAVRALWRKRQNDGWTQRRLAETIGRDPAWVSRQLRGPANWTMRSLGELVEAMDGDLVVLARPLELPVPEDGNFDGYLKWLPTPASRSAALSTNAASYVRMRLDSKPDEPPTTTSSQTAPVLVRADA